MDDFDTFEGEITPSLVERLNETLRGSWESDNLFLVDTRPGATTIRDTIRDTMHAQRTNDEPKLDATKKCSNFKTVCFIALVAMVTVIWTPFQDPVHHLVQPPAVASVATSTSPKTCAKVSSEPRNLAITNEGAFILEEYTSPPSFSSYSNDISLDPLCVLQPKPTKGWPLATDSALGIQLGQAANITSVKLTCRWDTPLPVFKDFSVYRVSHEGDIRLLGTRKNSQEIVFENPVLVSRLIIRIRCTADTLSSNHGSLRSVQIIGITGLS